MEADNMTGYQDSSTANGCQVTCSIGLDNNSLANQHQIIAKTNAFYQLNSK